MKRLWLRRSRCGCGWDCSRSGSFRPATRKPLRALTALAGLLTLLLVTFAAANWHLRRAVRTAIVVVPQATVHYGPLDESSSALSVRDGLELEVTDTKGEWVQVTDATRRVGRLRRDQVVLFPVAVNPRAVVNLGCCRGGPVSPDIPRL